jgi:hypothetical protein
MRDTLVDLGKILLVSLLVILLIAVLSTCAPPAETDPQKITLGYGIYRVVDVEYGNVCYVRADDIFCLKIEK